MYFRVMAASNNWTPLLNEYRFSVRCNLSKVEHPTKYSSYQNFEKAAKFYEGKLNEVKTKMKLRMGTYLYDMAPANDDLRSQVSEIVDVIVDIISLLQKSTSVPFKLDDNPLPRNLDLFEANLNDLLSKMSDK